jgi:hypothetical protein
MERTTTRVAAPSAHQAHAAATWRRRGTGRPIRADPADSRRACRFAAIYDTEVLVSQYAKKGLLIAAGLSQHEACWSAPRGLHGEGWPNVPGQGPWGVTVGSPRTHEWKRRPALAKLVRGAAWVVPIMASLGAAFAVSFLLTRPNGLGLLMWWAVIAAAGTLTLVVFEPLARRAVILAALLDLSLVFPSKAPSRSFIALGVSSHRRLQIRLIQTSAHNSFANGRIAERMALASALGVLRQERHRRTSRARAIGSAFVVAAALITGTVLLRAPRQAPLGHPAAGPAVAAHGPRAGIPASPSPPEGTLPSPTPTPAAGASNRVTGATTSEERRANSQPPTVAPSIPPLGLALSADASGVSAQPEGAGPGPPNAVAAAPGEAAARDATQPLAVASGQSAPSREAEPRVPAAAQGPAPLRTGGAATKHAPNGATCEEGGCSEAASPLPDAPPNPTVTSGATDSSAKTVGVSASREDRALPLRDVDGREAGG